MAFTCEPCHRKFTGRGFSDCMASGFGLMLSYGPCEDCRKTAPCSDCRCEPKPKPKEK